MIDPDRALELILSRAARLGAERAPLGEAVGRALAAELSANDDLPPFDNSAMDGYAVRSADVAGASPGSPARLRVRETVRAGRLPGGRLGPGEAAAVMTGAPLPPGSDAVVMQESTRRRDGWVEVLAAAGAGDHVRPRGGDVSKGQPLLGPGTLLRPYEAALLAAQGVTEVPVARRPRVALAATGDELIPPGAPLSPGKIRNCNGPALAAALGRWGAAARDLGALPDEPGVLREAFAGALEDADVLIVAGGVSVGDFDYTKAVLAATGVEEVFWKVAIKPGKPLYFGVRPRAGEPARLVFGLPGNPVAALVCLEEFVRPAIERLQGRGAGHPSYHLAGRASRSYPSSRDRRQYLFCRAKPAGEGFELDILRPQGSAMLGMAARANALAAASARPGGVRAGEVLPFRWLK